MSWDIYINAFPRDIKKVADIPDDFQPQPLGNRTDLIARILEVMPNADFSNPEYGVFEGNGFSIEFMMGSKEIAHGISLFVRGGGNPSPAIAALLDHMQLRGIDCQTSEFFDVEAAKASFGSWQQYRDKVIGLKPESDDGPKGQT